VVWKELVETVMKYPSQEQRESFVRELSELEAKYGFSLDVGGYEYEADFRPGSCGLSALAEEEMLRSKPETTAGWEDVLRYGPPTPLECLSPMEQAMRSVWDPAIRAHLETSELVSTIKAVGRIRVSGEWLKDFDPAADTE
jgi:hypothetical protein